MQLHIHCMLIIIRNLSHNDYFLAVLNQSFVCEIFVLSIKKCSLNRFLQTFFPKHSTPRVVIAIPAKRCYKQKVKNHYVNEHPFLNMTQ